MANPISTRGLRRIIDRLGDETMEATRKALKAGVEDGFESEGRVKLSGRFGFDKEGDLVVVGDLEAGPELLEGVAGAEVGTRSRRQSLSTGLGSLEVAWSVRVVLETRSPTDAVGFEVGGAEE